MIQGVFAVEDVKSGLFRAFFADTKVDAIRSFVDLANDGQSVPCKYPDDFRLVHLGSFDNNTGVLMANEGGKGVSLGFASEFKRSSNA